MLSLAIDNTNTPNRAYEVPAQDGGGSETRGESKPLHKSNAARPASVDAHVNAGRPAGQAGIEVVTAGETATELCFPNGAASAAIRSNPSLISGWSDLVEAGTGQTRAVLPQEPSKADDGRDVEAAGGAASVITNSNSRASSRANTAGDDHLLPVVAGTHPNLQAFSMPAEPTGEGFPTRLQPSPVIAIPLPIADSQADRPLASAGANAASLFYSTWSPWSVCKGSI